MGAGVSGGMGEGASGMPSLTVQELRPDPESYSDPQEPTALTHLHLPCLPPCGFHELPQQQLETKCSVPASLVF